MREDLSLESIPDDELLGRLSALLGDSRRVEADVVAHIAEVDARRLYAREATSSMFAYCTEVLHLSEFEAYLRITVARASRRHPELLACLADGRLHLTAIAKLAPHLTPQNADALLRRAQHRSKRQRELIAELAPRPDAPAIVRRLPERARLGPPVMPEPGLDAAGPPAELGPDRVEPSTLNERTRNASHSDATGVDPRLDSLRLSCAPPKTAQAAGAIEPLAPARYKVQFTGGPELPEVLERLQALMRSSVPDGDIATIILVALSEKLERLEARRFAKTKRPRTGLAEGTTTTTIGATTAAATAPMPSTSRHIPASLRRAVETRDGGRCVYQDRAGRRCSRRHDLEFHHRRPYGFGGEHSLENLALVCRTHNALLAELDYGRRTMARYRRHAASESRPHTRPGIAAAG